MPGDILLASIFVVSSPSHSNDEFRMRQCVLGCLLVDATGPTDDTALIFTLNRRLLQ